MPKEYSERFLQDKVIELFKKMGYKYLSLWRKRKQ